MSPGGDAHFSPPDPRKAIELALTGKHAETETIMDYGSDKVVTDVVRFNLGSAFFTMEPLQSHRPPLRTITVVDNGQEWCHR